MTKKDVCAYLGIKKSRLNELMNEPWFPVPLRQENGRCYWRSRDIQKAKTTHNLYVLIARTLTLRKARAARAINSTNAWQKLNLRERFKSLEEWLAAPEEEKYKERNPKLVLEENRRITRMWFLLYRIECEEARIKSSADGFNAYMKEQEEDVDVLVARCRRFGVIK